MFSLLQVVATNMKKKVNGNIMKYYTLHKSASSSCIENAEGIFSMVNAMVQSCLSLVKVMALTKKSLIEKNNDQLLFHYRTAEWLVMFSR